MTETNQLKQNLREFLMDRDWLPLNETTLLSTKIFVVSGEQKLMEDIIRNTPEGANAYLRGSIYRSNIEDAGQAFLSNKDQELVVYLKIKE